MLADVTALSDDEPAPAPVVVSRSRPSKKLAMQDPSKLMQLSLEIRSELRRVVAASCRCWRKGKRLSKMNCFVAFRDPAIFDQVAKLRKSMRSMHKADSDQVVPLKR